MWRACGPRARCPWPWASGSARPLRRARPLRSRMAWWSGGRWGTRWARVVQAPPEAWFGTCPPPCARHDRQPARHDLQPSPRDRGATGAGRRAHRRPAVDRPALRHGRNARGRRAPPRGASAVEQVLLPHPDRIGGLAGSLLVGVPATAVAVAGGVLAADSLWHKKMFRAALVNLAREVITL